MRLAKMVGLAALTVLAAMAIIGASSASALLPTALCKVNELPCAEANQVKELHMTLVGEPGVLHGLSPLLNVLCLNVLGLGEVLGLAAAGSGGQQVHLSKLDFTNCGTTATHSNCEIKSLELPILIDILKEAAGLGSATGLNGITLVNCKTILGTVHCEYTGAGLSFEVESALHKEGSGHGMLNTEGTPVKKVGGNSLCSAESTLTKGLLEPLEHVYISS